MNNFFILFAIWLFLLIGCGGSSDAASDGDDTNEQAVERGRLKYVVSATSIHTDITSIYRSVSSGFFINGKSWSPPGDANFAKKINWCDTSPNLNDEMLRCFGNASENYDTTYIVRMKNDQPYVLKINEGLQSNWIDENARWLLFKKEFFNVVTGEKIEVKGIPFADDRMSVFNLIGVSPDMKTIITLNDTVSKTEGKEEFLTLYVVDVVTGKNEKRKVSLTKYPWLTEYKQPEGNIQYPPTTAKRLIWKKDKEGRDRLAEPQLLEKIEDRKVE